MADDDTKVIIGGDSIAAAREALQKNGVEVMLPKVTVTGCGPICRASLMLALTASAAMADTWPQGRIPTDQPYYRQFEKRSKR